MGRRAEEGAGVGHRTVVKDGWWYRCKSSTALTLPEAHGGGMWVGNDG